MKKRNTHPYGTGGSVAFTAPGMRGAAERRLQHVRLLDAVEAPNTDRAIASALARLWTPALAARHGPAAAPRTVRRWRSRLRRLVAWGLADLAGARRGPKPDGRHAMVAAIAVDALDRPSATMRDVHAMHVAAISRANATASPAGGAAITPLSYSTVRRVAAAALRGR